jgi:hypothetical protein
MQERILANDKAKTIKMVNNNRYAMKSYKKLVTSNDNGDILSTCIVDFG